MNNFFKTRYFAYATVAVIATFALGLYIGWNNQPESFASSNNPAEEVDMSSFWKVWREIDEKYPDAANVSEEERLYGAISGLMESLGDPYSVFYAPEEAKAFEEDIRGSFSGVGMEVGLKDNILTVIAPLKNTPAYRAGILPGDKILQIDGVPIVGLSIEEAVKRIRGEKGSTVVLTILRESAEEPIEVSIIRDTINVPTLDTELRADGVFVIKLYSFTGRAATNFRNALREFSETKSNKLVLDLRGNPGGYLDAAVSVASWFLPSGTVIVTEDRGADEKPIAFRSKGYNAFNDNLRFVILIDGGSASASEIVAGALRDHKKALLVGGDSFGKGSVQEVVRITPETLIKITIAKWLTPSGLSISEEGLEPDYKIERTREDTLAGLDPQMDKAVEILQNWPGLR